MSDDAINFSKDILKKVSRSFALTIPMLDDKIHDAVMLTYLQDRLLDNFEDEVKNISIEQRKYLMDQVVAIFNPENNSNEAVKIIENKADLFSDEALYNLTKNASLLKKAHEKLDDEIREISYKWLVEMNEGMQKFLQKDVETFNDLDQYCYYVAGTVGGFLTELIINKSNISSEGAEKLKNNFKDAGLFLQKVNIIRDIKKDIENREKNYWPLKDLNIEKEMIVDKKYEKEMEKALNKMIADVEKHVKGLVTYMNYIPEEFSGYRKFFAVNNALGLATLDKIKSNKDKLFYGKSKVKVAKVQFLKIISRSEKSFYKMAENIE